MATEDRRGRSGNEKKEGLPPEVKEFDGYTELQPGQNFYDQPPFEGIVAQMSVKHTVNPHDLRLVLTRISERLASSTPEEAEAAFSRYTDIGNLNELRLGTDFFSRGKGTMDKARAAQEMLRELPLTVFAEWYKYVFWGKNADIYTPSGEYKASTTSPQMPSTYMQWLEEKTTQDARIRRLITMQVITETFPQQLAGASIGDVIPQGRRPTKKSWVIRAASKT